ASCRCASGGCKQVIVARTIPLIAIEPRVCRDRARCSAVHQVPVRRTVLVNKIVEILIVVPHRPVLFSAVAVTAGDVAVVVDDVIADRGPVVAGVPGPASEIALRSADQNSAVSVAE